MKKIFMLTILGLFAYNSFECGKFSNAIKTKWNNSLTKAAADDISSGAKNLKNKMSENSKKTKQKLGNFLKKAGNKLSGTSNQ